MCQKNKRLNIYTAAGASEEAWFDLAWLLGLTLNYLRILGRRKESSRGSYHVFCPLLRVLYPSPHSLDDILLPPQSFSHRFCQIQPRCGPVGSFLDGELGDLVSTSGSNFILLQDLGQVISHFWNSVWSSVQWVYWKRVPLQGLASHCVLTRTYLFFGPFFLALLQHRGWIEKYCFSASLAARGSHVT